MKTIILLLAVVCLAGCGNNNYPSTDTQSPNSSYTNSSGTTGIDTNNPATTNQIR